MQWSGLGFCYDDLSEERSTAHQLKSAGTISPSYGSLETIRKHVSSTVWWSGLGFVYDDLSEGRSAAHQLKYAILKTLIFKKANHLKNFNIFNPLWEKVPLITQFIYNSWKNPSFTCQLSSSKTVIRSFLFHAPNILTGRILSSTAISF